jgi:RNA polymerase sigma factor for flagellar operon FliA
MLDELRRLDWVPRSVRERAEQHLRLVPLETPATDQRGCSLSELVEDAHVEQPEHSSVRAEMREVLDASFDELPARDALVLRLHYYDELTLAEIGELLGISPSRTHGIHQRSLLELHGALEQTLGSGGVDSSSFSDAA